MLKRPGENLARTEDGATYNKLQRPDNWPVEPPRKPITDEEAHGNKVEVQEEGIDLDSSEDDSPKARQRKKRIYSLRKRNIGGADGCLPMDDEDFSGSDNDMVSFAARQYLKSVRAEANDLPVVSAAHMGLEQSEENYRGYYEDGAYVVAPELGPAFPGDYDEHYEGDYDYEEGEGDSPEIPNHFRQITACEAYTNALLSRFRHLRDAIRKRQIDASLIGGTEEGALQIPPMGRLRQIERQIWQHTITDKPPQPSRLATTSLDSVLALILIIKEQCLLRKKNVRKTISLWILALLASIDERTIDSETIYHLRDLAKKAIWLRIDFEPRFAEASEVMAKEAGYLSYDDEMESEVPVAKEAEAENKSDGDGMLSDLLVDETVPDDMTKATLDMIVTIVGEVFGQRDLLESRAVVDWPHVEMGVVEDDVQIKEV